MRKFNLGVLMVLCMVSVPFLVAASEEMVENPNYKAWAKFKTGASVKYKSVMDAGAAKTESEIVYSLVELTPEKAVVEMKGSTMIMGNKMDMPATKMEHPAKLPKTDPSVVAGNPTATPDAKAKESDGEIAVPAGKMKCHIIEATVKIGEVEAKSVVYMNDEVPGGLVKSVSETDKPMKSSTIVELVERKL